MRQMTLRSSLHTLSSACRQGRQAGRFLERAGQHNMHLRVDSSQLNAAPHALPSPWPTQPQKLDGSTEPTYVGVQVGKRGQHHLAAQVYLPSPGVCCCVAGGIQRCHYAIPDLQQNARGIRAGASGRAKDCRCGKAAVKVRRRRTRYGGAVMPCHYRTDGHTCKQPNHAWLRRAVAALLSSSTSRPAKAVHTCLEVKFGDIVHAHRGTRWQLAGDAARGHVRIGQHVVALGRQLHAAWRAHGRGRWDGRVRRGSNTGGGAAARTLPPRLLRQPGWRVGTARTGWRGGKLARAEWEG